nr:RNA-directed DNA polymerase, eukaryota [Tanacetum cinerariifolium]
MLHHTGVNSWFHDLLAATHDLVINERIVWVDIEGLPLNLWSSASFSKIGQKWGNVMDIEESSGSSFARKRLCIMTNHQQEIQAESHIEKGASLKVSVSTNGFTQEHFVNDSACEATTQVQSRFTHNGGYILDVLDDMIKVGRSMGYEMEGCSNDIDRIIGLQGVVGGS